MVLSLGGMYGPSWVAHVRHSADPCEFNDDALAQVWPLERYAREPAFEDDAIATYYLTAFHPWAYRGLYAAAARVVEPVAFSKVLPYGLWAVTAILVAVTAWRLAGWSGAWLAMALFFSADTYLAHVVGGLPRGFAFPVTAGAIAACVLGRVGWLCVCVVVGAMFYPSSAVGPGVMLAGWMLLPGRWVGRGEGVMGGWRRRWGLTAGVAGLCVVMVLPQWWGGRAYGRMLGPGDAGVYPEWGPDGRWSRNVEAAGFRRPGWQVVDQAASALDTTGKRWSRGAWSWFGQPVGKSEISRRDVLMYGALMLAAAGMVGWGRRDEGDVRLSVAAGSALGAFGLAGLCEPYLFFPVRQIVFAGPVLTTLGLAAGASRLGERLAGLASRGRGVIRAAVVLGTAGVVLLAMGGRGNPYAGLTGAVEAGDPVLAGCAALPAGTVIAAWPSGMAEVIPYVCRRSVLVSYETHQVFHEKFTLEMRRRTEALIEAYFAMDVGPLRRLRDEFGVDVLLVDRFDYQERPSYFAPFDAMIERVTENFDVSRNEVLRQAKWAEAFSTGRYVALDLRKLEP